MEFVLCHEVLHLVLLTHLRRGSRDPRLWNYSTDFAINFSLKENIGSNPSRYEIAGIKIVVEAFLFIYLFYYPYL